MQLHATFSPAVEAALEGDTGLHALDVSVVHPQAGDLMTVRCSPSGRTLELRCTRRHFRFDESGKSRVEFHFDLA